MNKHGQTLILFVILIPLIIGLCALVVDTGLVLSKKVQLKEVSKLVIKETIENSYSNEQAIKLFEKNKVNVDNLDLDISNNRVEVKNEIGVKSIFGNIIGIKNYDIKIEIVGYKKEQKIVFE